MNMVRLFGKPMRVNKASQDRRTVDVGANLFIGNLAPEVDEKDLYDTFSAFGGIAQPPKVRARTKRGGMCQAGRRLWFDLSLHASAPRPTPHR